MSKKKKKDEEVVLSDRVKNLPGIIVSSDPSVWMSCRIITPNLEAAYRQAFDTSANYFSLTLDMAPDEVQTLARSIYAAKPDRLIFIDHVPHPEELLKYLTDFYGTKPLPPIYVHIYGDFTLYTAQWLRVTDILKKTRVKFICASHRQVKLVSRFLVNDTDAVERCPFPVNTATYHYDAQLREHWRTKLGLKNGEISILYTGRLSLQKNITRLVKEVLAFYSATKLPVRLYIAGTFDDLGAPFFGIKLPRNFYFQHWLEMLQALPAEAQERVHYLGKFDAQELKGLYNAADIYASLSLHHDEDYGMSPAEALCCGAPVLLSDWGGYSSFAADKNSCSLVSVKINRQGLTISSESFQKNLLRLAMSGHGDATRAKRADLYQNELSINAASEMIKKIHQKEAPNFWGFNWLMLRYTECFKEAVPYPSGPKKGTFYEEIYDAYVSSKK